MFQVYLDLLDRYCIHFNSVKQMGMNECKVNGLQYFGRQFIAEFIKYAHKLDQFVINIFNVSFPVKIIIDMETKVSAGADFGNRICIK